MNHPLPPQQQRLLKPEIRQGKMKIGQAVTFMTDATCRDAGLRTKVELNNFFNPPPHSDAVPKQKKNILKFFFQFSFYRKL